jgi:hypothetical protein
MTRDQEAMVVAAALTLVTGILFAASLTLHPAAAAVPLVVAGLTLLLLVDQFVAEWRRRRRFGDADTRHQPPADPPRREISTLGWMLLLPMLMWAFGLMLALPAYLLLYLRVRSGEPWSGTIIAAAVAWCVVVVVLDGLLGIELHSGALWDWVVRP